MARGDKNEAKTKRPDEYGYDESVGHYRKWVFNWRKADTSLQYVNEQTDKKITRAE